MKWWNNWKENGRIVKENLRMRRSKKALEESYRTLSMKYLELLETKAERFDRYLEYYDLCKELMNERRTLKRHLAKKEEIINELNQELLKYAKEHS